MEYATTILKSNKGVNDKVFHHGYEYMKDGHNKDGTTIYYSCVLYKSTKCSGRLIQNMKKPEGQQIKVSKVHIHAPDARSVNKSVVVNNLKRKAKETVEFGRNVLDKVTENLDVATAASMSSTSSLLKTVRRVRVDNNLPSIPTSLLDLIVPEEFAQFNGEPFLLYDSGPSDHRILIFSTEHNLNYLKRAGVVLMDGTFDVVPPLFEQLYTMQGRIGKWFVPLVYILTPNKTRRMYEQAFEVISARVPGFAPKYVLTDFEIGPINAAKKYFPSAVMHACFFHLCQSIWRHIGLQARYSNHAVFALNVRQLLALAYVPRDDIIHRFCQLCEFAFWANEDDEDSQKLQALLNYFETTYIGLALRNNSRRRKVLFSPSLWSVYEITKSAIPRTTNPLEAWHGVLKRSIGGTHVTIFKFFKALQLEQSIQQTRMARIDSGNDPDIVPLKYRKLNERILKILDTYDNSPDFNIEYYLTRMAHNINF